MGKKRGNQHRRLFSAVRGFARAKGLPTNRDWAFYAPYLEEFAGIQAPGVGEPESSGRGRCKRAFSALLEADKKLPSAGKKRLAPRRDARAFYQSLEWRQMRMHIIKKYGARCQCCGRTPEHGIIINVDHIKPLKANWHLRLDENNLQVLCNICNHGKGNWDETDWRGAMPSPSQL